MSLDEEFAPGGLDDVKEVLGGDNRDTEKVDALPVEESNAAAPSEPVAKDDANQNNPTSEEAQVSKQEEQIPIESVVSQSPGAMEERKSQDSTTVVAVAPADDTASAMPPPSAPLGPAVQFGDAHREHGFIARGRGGFAGRGRGGFMQNGVASKPDFPLNAPTEPKGQGVAGAPTGPKALRPGYVAPPARGRGGLQIVGRAAMASRENQALPPSSATRCVVFNHVNGFSHVFQLLVTCSRKVPLTIEIKIALASSTSPASPFRLSVRLRVRGRATPREEA